MDDGEAVRKTLQGEREAFGELVHRHQAKVYTAALARVYDRQDAQDLCQEAFLRAYLRLSTLRDRDAFAPWLFIILRRLCVDFVRGKWRKERGEQTMKTVQGDSEVAADPRNEILASEAAETLWAQIGKLDDTSREVLSLHYGQDLKVSEIASLTGARESAVKMRLQKARARLGDRVGHLKGVWGIAPLPALSAGVMKAIAGASPVKGVIAASSPWLGGIAAFVTLLWWPVSRDFKGWQGHAPAAMVTRSKWRVAFEIVLLIALVFVAAPLSSRYIALHMHRLVQYPVFFYTYFALMGVVFVAIIKRETELLATRDKVRQFINIGFAIVMSAGMCSLPIHTAFANGLFLGSFLALQYFFVNKSQLAAAAIPPGLWVTSVLSHVCASESLPIHTTKQQIREWFVLLHEFGLVAPPCKADEQSVKVRLRLRPYLVADKMTRRMGTFMHVTTEGQVTCMVAPRDYIVFAQGFGAENLPGRQDLGVRLGAAFTRAFAVYVRGGDKSAVADALGLSQCPMDITKSNRYLVMKYVFPGIGVLLMVGAVLLRLLQ